MGFPAGYSEFFIPKLILHILSVFSFIRKLICTLFQFFGFRDFLESEVSGPDTLIRIPEFESVTMLLIREILPVVRFGELLDPSDSCAVCLTEFEEDNEIRRLSNCKHVFHRGCLDRWMGYDQRTCPLCRTPLIPHDLQGAFNERLWAASGIPEFYGEYHPHVAAASS